jgi:hypothetical protein
MTTKTPTKEQMKTWTEAEFDDLIDEKLCVYNSDDPVIIMDGEHHARNGGARGRHHQLPTHSIDGTQCSSTSTVSSNSNGEQQQQQMMASSFYQLSFQQDDDDDDVEDINSSNQQQHNGDMQRSANELMVRSC